MIIWNLAWKDDSFRTYLWSGSTPSVTSDGDFLYVPAGQSAFRLIYPTVSASSVFQIDVRARYVTSPAPIQIKLYDTSGHNVIYTTGVNYDINYNGVSGITSSTYAWYTTGGPIQIPATVGGISLVASGGNEIDFDYVCFTSSTSYAFGGSKVDVQVNKKTPVLRIPNAPDVIQQLGISSRAETFAFPKLSRPSFNSIETLVRNNTPVECVSPDFQATGFFTDVTAETQAGWVGIGIDNGPVGQLYDVTPTFIKADRDVDSLAVT